MADEEKKKSFSQRFAEYFMSIDIKAILKTELEQTLWPHLLDTLVDSAKDAFSNTMDELAYRGKKSEARARKSSGHMPYNSFFDGDRSRNVKRTPLLASPNYVVKDIPCESREAAGEILDQLQDMLNSPEFDFVTVLNLYNVAGMPTNSTMEDFGWYDISTARVYKNPNNGTWTLRMPRPQRI